MAASTSSAPIRAQIAAIESKISTLEQEIASLRREKQPLEDQLRAVVYPVAALPLDVLGEVFRHAAPLSSPKRSPAGSIIYNSLPLTVAAVCHPWRQAALTTSWLWNRLRVLCTEDAAAMVPIIQLWLSRSGSQPLAIDAFTARDPQAIPGLCDAILMATILEFADRWNVVAITPTELRVSTKQWPRTFPLLRKLTINSATRFTGDEGAYWPLIRELCLQRPLGNNFPHLRNLRSLSFLAHSAAEALRVLKECPLLEALSITVRGIRRCPEELTLPFLRTLELGSHDAALGLPKLIVPRLEQISFVDLTQEGISRIKDLLARSACKLNSIKLTCNELTPSQSLAEVLPSLPLAQELTLSYRAWTIKDLRLLRHCQPTVTRLNFEGSLELGDIDSGKFRSTLQSWAASGDRDASKRVVLRLGDSFVTRGLVEEL